MCIFCLGAYPSSLAGSCAFISVASVSKTPRTVSSVRFGCDWKKKSVLCRLFVCRNLTFRVSSFANGSKVSKCAVAEDTWASAAIFSVIVKFSGYFDYFW